MYIAIGAKKRTEFLLHWQEFGKYFGMCPLSFGDAVRGLLKVDPKQLKKRVAKKKVAKKAVKKTARKKG